MFEPKFCLLIEQDAFTDKSAACLGSQLVELIEFMDEKLPAHEWYGANVVAPGVAWVGYDKFKLKHIGETETLLAKAQTTLQFEYGVFVAIGLPFLSQVIDEELDTEDKRFRKIALDGVLIEIRTFDFGYFLIFSEEKRILEIVNTYFGGRIESIETFN